MIAVNLVQKKAQIENRILAVQNKADSGTMKLTWQTTDMVATENHRDKVANEGHMSLLLLQEQDGLLM